MKHRFFIALTAVSPVLRAAASAPISPNSFCLLARELSFSGGRLTTRALANHLVATVPGDCAIRITAREELPDLPLPPDGRITFEMPIGSRYRTPYLFGFLKVCWSTPVEKRRVIKVVRGEKVLRRLSARDISKLETDPDGFQILKLKR